MPDNKLMPAAEDNTPRQPRLRRLALPLAVGAAVAATAAAVALAATNTTTSTPSPRPEMPPGMAMNAGQPPSGAVPPSTGGGAPGDNPSAQLTPGAPSAPSDLATALGRQLAGNGQQAIPLPRVEALANQRPAGAQVDPTTKTVRFTSAQVNLVVVASPPTADMKFRAAGIDNHTIEVPEIGRASCRERVYVLV